MIDDDDDDEPMNRQQTAQQQQLTTTTRHTVDHTGTVQLEQIITTIEALYKQQRCILYGYD
jgi:hypothetical protein